MLFGAVTAYPAVSAARSLPDTGGFLSGGPIEIAIDRPRQTRSGNWASVGIAGNSRSAGEVGQRADGIGRNILGAEVGKIGRYRLSGKIRDNLRVTLERVHRTPTAGTADAYG